METGVTGSGFSAAIKATAFSLQLRNKSINIGRENSGAPGTLVVS